MHQLFRVLALVGIASLCLASQGALANSIGVAQGVTAGCNVSTGNGEQNITASCSPDGSGNSTAAVSFPPPDITGSIVSGTATGTASLNQSITLSASLTQMGGLVAVGNSEADGSLSYFVQINPLDPTNPINSVAIRMVSIANNIFSGVADVFASGGTATANTSLTVMTSDQTQTIFQDNQNPTIQQLTAVNGATKANNAVLDFTVGALYEVDLQATAQVKQTSGTATASLDPTFSFVDPADASLFEIDFSPGIINGAPDTSVTPLPGTLPLFAGGLGLVGFLTKRRKSATQTLATA